MTGQYSVAGIAMKSVEEEHAHEEKARKAFVAMTGREPDSIKIDILRSGDLEFQYHRYGTGFSMKLAGEKYFPCCGRVRTLQDIGHRLYDLGYNTRCGCE